VGVEWTSLWNTSDSSLERPEVGEKSFVEDGAQ